MTLLERRRAMMQQQKAEWNILLPENGEEEGYIPVKRIFLQAGQTLIIQWERTTIVSDSSNYLFVCATRNATDPYYRRAMGNALNGQCSVQLIDGYTNIRFSIAGHSITADGAVRPEWNFYGNYIKYRIT